MKRAFTLAEVLITLAIIGVIAAISVPSLIQKTNQAELVTAWKKEYATISQAAAKYAFDIGTIPKFANALEYSNSMDDYLKVIKTCPNATQNGICWHKANEWYKMNGESKNTIFDNNPQYSSMILANGTLIRFLSNQSCATGTINYNELAQRCVGIYFDINGFKKPNTMGKDIFGADMYSDGTVTPYSSSTTYNGANGNIACNTTTADNWGDYGLGCSSEYLYQK